MTPGPTRRDAQDPTMPPIGIISDTHGRLRPEALAALVGVAHIVHAGDIGDPDIVARLSEIAPVTAIRGNVDRAPWAERYPHTASVDLRGRRLFVIHDRNELSFDPRAAGYDVVVSGHSHRPRVETIDGVLYLNPGSAGPQRFRLPVTIATLLWNGGEIEAEIHSLMPDGPGRTRQAPARFSPS